MSDKLKKNIFEDTIQCLFFDLSLNSDADAWVELCEKLNETIKKLSGTYIWHKEEFRIYLPIDNHGNEDLPHHLISTTCFGDNIEDEWFIVYLVLEITKQYKNLIVQMTDNDGDFLLIEAADYLPAWANPETTENRVFIHNNQVHVISPGAIDIKTEVILKDALTFVADERVKTEMPNILQAVLKRIGNTKEKLKENVHTAVVNLPLDLAAILTLKPALISPIVNTYCNHDSIDAKSFKHVKLGDYMPVEIKFTRCLYAMLIHSKQINNYKNVIFNQKDKRSVLGIKLKHGYDMIMRTADLDSALYKKFLNSLNEKGYFKDNIEGSEMHKDLLEKAKEFYLNIESPTNTYICNKILEVMKTNEFIEVRDILKNRIVGEIDFKDDNEDWLNIHPEQLNDFLKSRYGEQAKIMQHDVITPEVVTTELSTFLQKSSHFEGLEMHEVEDGIEFDVDEFVESLQNMLNLVTSGDSLDLQNDINGLDEDDMDREIKTKLCTDESSDVKCSEKVMFNLKQSLKEEKGSPGPSSNLLKAIGINKTELLDSDDD